MCRVVRKGRGIQLSMSIIRGVLSGSCIVSCHVMTSHVMSCHVLSCIPSSVRLSKASCISSSTWSNRTFIRLKVLKSMFAISNSNKLVVVYKWYIDVILVARSFE